MSMQGMKSLSQLRAGIDVVCPDRRERSGGADRHPSRLDRRDEGLPAEDVHDPREIVGEHVQGHLGGNLRQAARFAAIRPSRPSVPLPGGLARRDDRPRSARALLAWSRH
jgi:hypothetical protein